MTDRENTANTCPFIESPKNKIIVCGGKSIETKDFLKSILNDTNDVAYLTLSSLVQNDISVIPAGVYIIQGGDEVFIDYVKKASTFIFYFPNDFNTFQDTFASFSKVYDFIETYNREINFIFVSTTEVYGKKRTGMLFTDSELKPGTKRGIVYQTMEHYVSLLPHYKIIRIPELYTKAVEEEMKSFIAYIKNQSVIKIPSQKEYINFIYTETLNKAIKILINSQYSTIVHLTDTPNLTFQNFIQSVAKIYGKKIKYTTKFNFIISTFKIDIPDVFKYDQNLSTIEQESLGLEEYRTTEMAVKELIEKTKNVK